MLAFKKFMKTHLLPCAAFSVGQKLSIADKNCAMQSAKMKVQKYSGVRADPNPIGPPQQAAGPSGPNGTPQGPHGPAGI